MTALDLINLITTGGPLGILAVAVYAFVSGRVIPRSTYQDALDEKEARIAELTRREAELWLILRQTAGWTTQLTSVAEQVTRVATRREDWPAAQAPAERRSPARPPRPPP